MPQVLSTFAKEARDSPYMSEDSIRMSQDLMRETSEILVESGRCYRTVLSLDPRDARALLNWGSALCLRAKLIETKDAENAIALYDAAIEKFDVSSFVFPSLVSFVFVADFLIFVLRSDCRPPCNSSLTWSKERERWTGRGGPLIIFCDPWSFSNRFWSQEN